MVDAYETFFETTATGIYVFLIIGVVESFTLFIFQVHAYFIWWMVLQAILIFVSCFPVVWGHPSVEALPSGSQMFQFPPVCSPQVKSSHTSPWTPKNGEPFLGHQTRQTRRIFFLAGTLGGTSQEGMGQRFIDSCLALGSRSKNHYWLLNTAPISCTSLTKVTDLEGVHSHCPHQARFPSSQSYKIGLTHRLGTDVLQYTAPPFLSSWVLSEELLPVLVAESRKPSGQPL